MTEERGYPNDALKLFQLSQFKLCESNDPRAPALGAGLRVDSAAPWPTGAGGYGAIGVGCCVGHLAAAPRERSGGYGVGDRASRTGPWAARYC